MTEVDFNRQRTISVQLPFAVAFPLSTLVYVKVENTRSKHLAGLVDDWQGRKGNTLQMWPSTFIMVS